ncbi:MAG TPA: phosphoenolpyruvate--protein phosphotransferase, partial [Hyphomicrobiaceae bacterium]|nr:phosphoenolpyruvate--protein phosphotransferase [Hyphomicrobiaceae bacterium]
MQSEPALRVMTRRLREIMAEPADGQARLDKIVRQISGLMVAEVCSIYFKRQDGSLELFATEGLNPDAVHQTRLNRGEGLVGRAAELAAPVNEPEAQSHPAFSFRPETGEERYHSLLAVPILRGGAVLGVIVVQNRTQRTYSEEDIEVLQTTAMVVAEHLASGDVAHTGLDDGPGLAVLESLRGASISDGIALGHVVLHEPRVVVTKLLAEDPEIETARLEKGVRDLRSNIDEMIRRETVSHAGAHQEVLEAYSLFANDKGWHRRLLAAVAEGLTAEAAVERVQNVTRARMLSQNDPFWRERLKDLDDLSDRLLRILAGRSSAAKEGVELPADTVLIARNMGPAELLDYDSTRLRGLVVEDAGPQSHVAIVARALGIAAVGELPGIIERTTSGDAIIVDGETGEVHLRPSPEVVNAYNDKVRFRARRQQQYQALRDKPAITKDGQHVALMMNAGLMADMGHLAESGSDGIGLFRTELQFMIVSTFPKLDQQIETYRKIIDASAGKPVVFRALDIGGDKALPYLRQPKEDNPAIGWRAIRLALDRPGLFRLQVRALLRATAGQTLRVMVPMVTTAQEMDAAKALIETERALLTKRGYEAPAEVLVGAMVEVPSILFDINSLLSRVDFISVGSNDLLQFLFAADRANPLVASRYDPLSVSALRVLRDVVTAADKRGVAVTLCGEMAAHPLEAMALIGLGFRSISMAPAAIGPLKNMVLSLHAGRIRDFLE